jgi:hypothetical protein
MILKEAKLKQETTILAGRRGEPLPDGSTGLVFLLLVFHQESRYRSLVNPTVGCAKRLEYRDRYRYNLVFFLCSVLWL